MGIKRLQYELKRLEALELRHIIDEMASHGDSKVVMAFNGTQSQPVAAVALITGPDTKDYLKALEQPESSEWPEANDRMTAYLQEKAKAAGFQPHELDFKLSCFAGLILADVTGQPENAHG